MWNAIVLHSYFDRIYGDELGFVHVHLRSLGGRKRNVFLALCYYEYLHVLKLIVIYLCTLRSVLKQNERDLSVCKSSLLCHRAFTSSKTLNKSSELQQAVLFATVPGSTCLSR